MAGPTEQSVQDFGQLEEVYDKKSYYQENVRPSFFKFIKHASQNEIPFDGKNFNVFLKLQLNESYAAINDDEQLPVSETPKSVPAQYRSKNMYSQIEITSKAATRGYKGHRVDGKYIDDMVKGTEIVFGSGNDFDALGNGRGYRATISSATPAASSFVVVTSAMLRPAMTLDWYDSTLTTKRGTIKVATKSVDRMTRTVYIDATYGTGSVPAGATAGDKLVVYRALDPGEPSDGRYMLGYQRIVDNTVAIGGVSPSSYAAWLSPVQNAGGGNPSQELLQIQWDVTDQISGMYPNRMAFNPSWKRGYMNNFLSQRRFISADFQTGMSDLSFSPVRMGADAKYKKVPSHLSLESKDVDPTQVLIWNYDAFCFAPDYSDVPHLADEDGAEFRYKLGFDAMQGFMRYWGNIVVFQRNAIGYIYNQALQSNTI